MIFDGYQKNDSLSLFKIIPLFAWLFSIIRNNLLILSSGILANVLTTNFSQNTQ